jgi:hypothetical protein
LQQGAKEASRSFWRSNTVIPGRVKAAQPLKCEPGNPDMFGTVGDSDAEIPDSRPASAGHAPE